MTAANARSTWSRMISTYGEIGVLKRIGPTGASLFEVTVRMRDMSFRNRQDSSGGSDFTQAVTLVWILAEDVESSGFPLPIRAQGNDRIVIRGQNYTPQNVDDSTHRYGSVLVAYEMMIEG